MEKVLDRTVTRESILTSTGNGLYELTIRDGAKRILLRERNVSLVRAAAIIEENTYQEED